HQDLQRHLYIHGIVNVGMTDFTLEINDEGRPYWVVSLYEHKISYHYVKYYYQSFYLNYTLP
ncbi:hypothetical protein D1N45_19485, partial [Clostridioides difficile]|uniref:hypothetical protein n=1 Tax=Clostridioides difficile TaxID=1496 RepID=UPI00115CF0B6